MIEKINLAHKLTLFTDHWQPKVIGALNGQWVKLARLEGSYVWHRHDNEDELFLVIQGRLRMELRDGALELAPGELCIVPRGVEHCPVADGETAVLLFEPAATRSTGDVDDARSLEANELEWI